MNNESINQVEVKNIVFLVLSSGITYGGITSYCNMYYEEFGADINFYFIYSEADYSKGLRNTISMSDSIRINDLFENVLEPSNTIIISTRIGLFNEFFRTYPAITINYPVIVEHHANMLDYLSESKWLRDHFLPEHSRMSAINALKVFTKAESFEARKFFKGKILSIPNPSLSSKKQLKYNPNKVVFVARLDESQKNLTMLVDVVKKLKARQNDIVINVYGDGPDRKMLESISDIAILHGRVDDKDEIYNDACVVISTSHWEGFGLTLLEGAAYGVPAVSTKHCPAICELITHDENGYLFDVSQVDDFVSAIENICIDSELRASLSEKASLAALNYSKDVVMNNYLHEMSKCIEDNLSLDTANGMQSALSYFAKCYVYKLKEIDGLKSRIQ